ncbi:MAG: DUF58 domain-containing protein [Planctomycetota bacterium]|nr:DUF58 domain-containing protein [Planctomycetota bacterium]MDA1214426.1 DUF58 domain-containing protein [Planctomycetota bacterium]
MSTSPFFDPAGLARVGNLELVAKQVVEGFLTGRHRSPYHGFSVEYLDHRSYSPGDEIRSLDWKVLARTNKYYVKLFEDETNLRAYILLDCSKSMEFQSGSLSKLAYGSYLAAALTYLMIRQNDAVGLVRFDTEPRQFIAPRAHPTQFRRVLDSLDNAKAGGETDVGLVLHKTAERIKRRGLVIVISDLIDDEDKIVSGLQHFRHDHHEVIVFHIMDDAELTFPYDRITRFQDMEGAGRVVANPKSLRARYLSRIKAFTEKLKHDCFERRISYNLVNTNQPYAEFLAAYLDKRKRMG